MIIDNTIVDANINPSANISASKINRTELNADSLDGHDSSYYLNAGNLNAGILLEARIPQNAIDSSEIEENSITESNLAPESVGFSELQKPLQLSSGWTWTANTHINTSRLPPMVTTGCKMVQNM